MTPGIAGYPGQFGNVLIKKESFDKFINTMVGVPVIINHKDITAKNANDERVGVVSNVWFDDKDGWYWCDGVIWDETAQNLITVKGWSVSCSYDVKLADDAGGTENNIPYDIEFLDGVFTHLAIVDNPRYERANIVFNSKTEVINDKWITIHPNGEDSKGRPLLLKDGENVYEAMQRQWGISSPGQQHLFSVSKYKTDDNYKKELDAKIAELNKQVEESRQEEARRVAKKIKDNFLSGNMPMSEYSKKAADFEKKYGVQLHKVKVENFDPNQKRDKKGRWAKDDAAIQKKKDSLTPIEVKPEEVPKFKTKEELGEWFSGIFKDLGSVTIEDTGIRIDLYGGNAEREAFKRRLQQEPNKAVAKAFEDVVTKSVKVDERQKDERHKHNQEIYYNKLKLGDNFYDVNLFVDYLEPNQEYRYAGHSTTKIDNKISTRDTQVINHIMLTKADILNTVSNNIIASIAMETLKPSNNIITDNREDFNPDIKNNVQNNKEQDMALLDELKKLITKVENEKPEGENMDENEVKNEKVDKRKLIDEVAGIMKSAGADDEKIRTAIAKMEKLAYDKSEAGTADNEKEDEPKDDKPADNSKVKNEETKEDEKKYDDLKKDVKEDVQNKCKNSVDNAKGGFFDKMNEIYNAATQPSEENTYISREQKLKYAEEYFAK